jgi:hypothetical protein
MPLFAKLLITGIAFLSAGLVGVAFWEESVEPGGPYGPSPEVQVEVITATPTPSATPSPSPSPTSTSTPRPTRTPTAEPTQTPVVIIETVVTIQTAVVIVETVVIVEPPPLPTPTCDAPGKADCGRSNSIHCRRCS